MGSCSFGRKPLALGAGEAPGRRGREGVGEEERGTDAGDGGRREGGSIATLRMWSGRISGMEGDWERWRVRGPMGRVCAGYCMDDGRPRLTPAHNPSVLSQYGALLLPLSTVPLLHTAV